MRRARLLRCGLGCLLLLVACRSPAPNPKADLLRVFPGASAEGYRFSATEDEERAVASLINRALGQRVTVGSGRPNMTLGFMRVTDKRNGAMSLFKNELDNTGPRPAVVATDLSTNAIVKRLTIAPQAPGICDNQPRYDSLDECVCKEKAPFQCDADRTCDTLIGSFLCCLKGSDNAIDVHVLITPAFSRRCLLKDIVTDLGGLVFTP